MESWPKGSDEISNLYIILFISSQPETSGNSQKVHRESGFPLLFVLSIYFYKLYTSNSFLLNQSSINPFSNPFKSFLDLTQNEVLENWTLSLQNADGYHILNLFFFLKKKTASFCLLLRIDNKPISITSFSDSEFCKWHTCCLKRYIIFSVPSPLPITLTI